MDDKTSSILDREEFYLKLKCIDEPYEVRGDNQSFTADALLVAFE